MRIIYSWRSLSLLQKLNRPRVHLKRASFCFVSATSAAAN